MSDPRDRDIYPSWGVKVDEHRKVLHIFNEEAGDLVARQAVFEVCPLCQGEGTHVNPSIDAHGIGAEEFAEDPDFAEDYRRGRFDVPCRWCGGMRVVLVPEDEAGKEDLRKVMEAESQTRAEYAAERAMGA